MHRTWIQTVATLISFSLVVLSLTANDASNSEAKPPTSRIEVVTVIQAPLAAVWRAWTTSEGLQEFFAPECECELFPGGKYNIHFAPDAPPGERGAEGQRVLSFLPMEMISFEWGAPPSFPFAREHMGWVIIQFEPVDEVRTHVRLVHTGFDELKRKHPGHAAEFDETKAYFENAWPMVMMSLEKRFQVGPRWDASGKERWQR